MNQNTRRILYLLFLIAVAAPMIRPVPMAMMVKQETQDLYSAIEALRPGSVVVMSFDYSPGTASDIHAAAVAVMTHIMKRPDVRVIGVAFVTDGPQFAEQAFAAVAEGKVYGKDYVDLGYRAGGENAIAAFAQDMKRTFPVDLKGNRTSEMQVLAGIAGVKDVSMVISMAGGTPGPAEWIRQAYQPYGTTVAGIVTTVMVPPNLAYVQSKQMIALLYGLRGAAEYELLIGRPGNGLAGMGSQSAAAVFILAAVIVGNVRRVKREH